MSKQGEESLFENVDLDNTGGTDDEGLIDTSLFTQDAVETEETKIVPVVATEEKKKKETNTETETDEGEIDTTLFETKDISDSDTDDDDIDTSINDSSANNSSSPMRLFAKTLQAEGVIDLEENVEIKSSKELVEAVRKKINAEELSDLDEMQKAYVTALRNGIPDEEIRANFNNIKALDGITEQGIEANEELQKILIAQEFIANGMEPSKAEKLAARSIEVGESVEDAKDAYRSLKASENARLKNENERIAKEKADEITKSKEYLADLKSRVLAKDEIIKDFKMNSTTAEKVFNNMTEIVEYDKKGNPLNALNALRAKDPEELELIENYLYVVTDGFKDWSSFKKTVKSNAIKTLDKQLKANQSAGGSSKGIESTTAKGLFDAISNFTE